MGLDLVLLPFDGDDFSQTVLPLHEYREFYEALLEEQGRIGRDVPDDFRCLLAPDEKCGSTGYGIATEDSYGEPIKRVRADQLVAFFNRWPDLGDESMAVLSYLKKMPPRRMIALFWK